MCTYIELLCVSDLDIPLTALLWLITSNHMGFFIIHAMYFCHVNSKMNLIVCNKCIFGIKEQVTFVIQMLAFHGIY